MISGILWFLEPYDNAPQTCAPLDLIPPSGGSLRVHPHMERYFKKYFVSVLARGMVDLTSSLLLDPGNLVFAGTLG